MLGRVLLSLHKTVVGLRVQVGLDRRGSHFTKIKKVIGGTETGRNKGLCHLVIHIPPFTRKRVFELSAVMSSTMRSVMVRYTSKFILIVARIMRRFRCEEGGKAQWVTLIGTRGHVFLTIELKTAKGKEQMRGQLPKM